MTDVRGVDWGEAADFESVPGAFSPLVKARDVKGEFTQEMIERIIQKTGLARGPEPSILGVKGGSVNFNLPVRGGKTAAGAGSESNMSKILSNCGMVRQNIADGIGKVTGGAAGNVTMLDADATGYAAGGWVCVNADKGGTPDVQLRYITEVESAAGTTTISVTPNFDTVPVNADDLYALDSFTPSPGEPTSYVGLDLYRGQGATNRHKVQALGCAGTWKIPTVALNELPMMELAFMIDTWEESEAARSDEDPDDLLADPRIMTTSALYWGTTELSTENFAFDPGFPLIVMPGTQYDNGRDGWWYQNPVPVFEIKPYWDAEFYDLWKNRTTEEAVLINLLDRYDFWGVAVTRAQVVNVEEDTIGEGLLSSKPTLLATDPHETAVEDDQLPLFSIVFSGA
jgi:hypothetical protein